MIAHYEAKGVLRTFTVRVGGTEGALTLSGFPVIFLPRSNLWVWSFDIDLVGLGFVQGTESDVIYPAIHEYMENELGLPTLKPLVGSGAN